MLHLFIYADWDKDGWNLYDGVNETRAVSKATLLDAKFWKDISGLTFRVEKEHFSPKGKFSLAQVYDQQELNKIIGYARSYNVPIQLLPHTQSFRVRLEGGYVDADGNHDKSHMAKANYEFYSRHAEIGLQAFPAKHNGARRLASTAIVQESNGRLNVMRADEEAYSGPECDRAKNIIFNNYDSISPKTREIFGIEKYKVTSKGHTKGDFNPNKFRMNAIMSIYTMVYDENGIVRRNSHGQFIGVDTVWRILRQHPYKGTRGGTARSNIMWHLRRNYLAKHVADKKSYRKTDITRLPSYRKANKEVSIAIKELIRLFRDNEQDYKA